MTFGRRVSGALILKLIAFSFNCLVGICTELITVKEIYETHYLLVSHNIHTTLELGYCAGGAYVYSGRRL